MKINKENERRLFLLGLLFVVTAYFTIQCVKNISLSFISITEIFTTLKPFLMALLISYVLYPIVKLIERKLKIKRFYSVLLTYTVFIATICISVTFLLPMLISSLSDLLKNLPQYLEQTQTAIIALATKFNINFALDITSTISTAITDFLPNLNNLLAKSVSSAVGTTITIFNSIFNAFITFVASFYILLEQESFIRTIQLFFKKIFKEETYALLSSIIKALHLNIGKYLLGKFSNSIFVGFIAFIGLSLCKSNYAGLLAILFGLMNMIPLIGPIIGTGVAVALNIFTSVSKSLFILVFLLIVQQFEGFILEPKTIGKSLNLNGFTTLLAISVFGQLFGMIGMILGIPIMSLLKKYIDKFLDPDENLSEENI